MDIVDRLQKIFDDEYLEYDVILEARDEIESLRQHISEKSSSESISIEDHEKLQSIKVAACIYVREEVDWEDVGFSDDINDDKAMEWFVNEYSEHNYG